MINHDARVHRSIDHSISFFWIESKREHVSTRASSGSNRRYRSPILGDKAVPVWLPRWKNDLSIAFFDNVYSRVKLQRKIGNRSRERAPTIRSLFSKPSPARIGQLLYRFKRFPREVAKLYLIFLRKIRTATERFHDKTSIPARYSSTDCRRSIDKRNLVERCWTSVNLLANISSRSGTSKDFLRRARFRADASNRSSPVQWFRL